MGRVKEAYHDKIIAGQEDRDAAMEDMMNCALLLDAVELCATSAEYLRFLLQGLYNRGLLDPLNQDDE